MPSSKYPPDSKNLGRSIAGRFQSRFSVINPMNYCKAKSTLESNSYSPQLLSFQWYHFGVSIEFVTLYASFTRQLKGKSYDPQRIYLYTFLLFSKKSFLIKRTLLEFLNFYIMLLLSSLTVFIKYNSKSCSLIDYNPYALFNYTY